MSFLSDRQRCELDKAILQYLGDAAGEDLRNKLSHPESSDAIPPHYLEKKWSTVLRLQRKILDLEGEVKQLNLNVTKPSFSNETDGFELARWVPNTISRVLKFHSFPVTALAMHPFQPTLATGSADGTIAIWNLKHLIEPETFMKNAHTKSITALAFSPQEIEETSKEKRILLASSSVDLFIKIWDCKSRMDNIRTFAGHDHSVSDLCFNPHDASKLVSCSRDRSIKVWDVVSGWTLRTFVGHSDWVRKIDISSSGEYILSCSNDQSVRLSFLASGTGLGLMVGHEQVVEVVRFLPQCSNEYLDKLALKVVGESSLVDNPVYKELGFKYCVSGGRDDNIIIWLLPVPKLRPHRSPLPGNNPQGIKLLTLKEHSSWVRDLRVHPNGEMFASCSDDKTVKFWDLRSCENGIKCINMLQHDGFVNVISFASPVNAEEVEQAGEERLKLLDEGMRCYFASGSVDNTVRVWK